MAATLELDLGQLKSFLEHEAEELAQIDFAPPLQAALVLIRSETLQRFQTATDPSGRAWAPLKRPRKSGRKSPLVDTGRLWNSIGVGAGNVTEITRTELTYGSNVSYAHWIQGGTRHMPARPFLGISDALQNRLEALFADYVERKLSGG